MAKPTRVDLSSATIDTVDAAVPAEFDATFMTTNNHGVKQCDPIRILLPDGTRMSDLSTDQAMPILHGLPKNTINTTLDDEEPNFELTTLAAAAFAGDDPLATKSRRAVQVAAHTVLAYIWACKVADGTQYPGDLRRASRAGEIFLLLPAYSGADPNQQHPSDQVAPQPDIATPPLLKQRRGGDSSTDTTLDTSWDRARKAGRETKVERETGSSDSRMPLSPTPGLWITLCWKKQMTAP